MAKFEQKKVIPTLNPVVKPISATPAPAPATAMEMEPALVVQADPTVAAEDIQDDGYGATKDHDKPNTKHNDVDFSKHDAFVGGRRMIQTDALARALNADCFLLDAPKDWGNNPLGGRPIQVMYTREFPTKNVLYDHFDASPETNTREKVDKLVAFKMKMANDHGFMYLYQHAWVTLTTTELDKQLDAQKAIVHKK